MVQNTDIRTNPNKAMKPYSPQTNAGRTRAQDDIHHRTADQSKKDANASAKVARHAARQEGRQQERILAPFFRD